MSNVKQLLANFVNESFSAHSLHDLVSYFVKDTLKQTCLSPGGGASCFRNSNDSRPAIRIAYRTLLRSSSI